MKRGIWLNRLEQWPAFAKEYEYFEGFCGNGIRYSVTKRRAPGNYWWQRTSYYGCAQLIDPVIATIARTGEHATAQAAKRAILRATRKFLNQALDAVT